MRFPEPILAQAPSVANSLIAWPDASVNAQQRAISGRQAERAADLAVDAAVAGVGIVSLFEDWLRPHLDSGALEPVREDWWQPFSGPFLYYSDRRLVPPPLRAFIDFTKVIAT